MNQKIRLFLDEVCRFINCGAVHDEVKEELSSHIGELMSWYQEQGWDEAQAAQKALSHMGDPGEIGRDLNKQHQPQTEWTLILLTGVIALFGIAAIFVSGRYKAQSAMFTKYIFSVILGAAVLVCTYFLDFTRLKRYAGLLYLSGVLLLVPSFLFGGFYRRRFLVIGPVGLSTAIVSSVLFLIAFCTAMDRLKGKGIRGIVKLYGIGLVPLLLLVGQPSVGTAFPLFITFVAVLLSGIARRHFGGDRRGQLLFVVFSGMALGFPAVVFALLNTNLIHRLEMLFSGGITDPFGDGWIYRMIGGMLQASAPWGTAALPEGIGENLMPNLTTDFAFLNIVGRFGWVTGIVLAALIAALIVRMLLTAGKINNSFGFYLLLGAGTMLSVQFVTGILMSLGLFPVIGIYIPLISYGGSGYVASMFLMGLILSIWRRNNLIRPEQREIPQKGQNGQADACP